MNYGNNEERSSLVVVYVLCIYKPKCELFFFICNSRQSRAYWKDKVLYAHTFFLCLYFFLLMVLVEHKSASLKNMDKNLKIVAIEALKGISNASNVIETIKQCYCSVSDEPTEEERFIIKELQDFIDALKK